MDPATGIAGMVTLIVLALVSLICVVIALAMAAPIVLIVYQSIKREGRWGMNFSIPNCPECGTKPPTFRTPANARQAMWGGWTCAECGTEMDKWGAKIES